MTGQVLPFKKPLKRDADGVLYVPPARMKGVIFVAYDRPKRRARKKWLIATQFCDGTIEIEDTMAADWHTAMFVGRCRGAKLGFKVVDLSDLFGGRPQS
jgi:hypothetical protein